MPEPLRTTALPALVTIPANPANLLFYAVDLSELDPDDQSKKMTLSLLDSRYAGSAVASVFGRTGAVVAASGDYSAAQITGLGSAALESSAAFATAAQGSLAATALQNAAAFATAAQGVKADSALQAAAIGVSVQAYNAGLASIAGLTTAADRMIYTTALDTYAVTPLTAFGRSLVDDVDAAAGRATLVAAGTGVANLFTTRQDIRANGSSLAAGLHVPWISGDTLSAAVFGSFSATVNPVQIIAGAAVALSVYNASTTSPALETQSYSTSTNAINQALYINHNTSATPIAGFGTQIRFRLNSSTTDNQIAGNIQYIWVDATHASRKARSLWSVYDTAEREAIRIEADGAAAMLGFYGSAAVARQTITGSRGGNAALADLLSKLATLGLLTDGSSA